MKNVIKEEANDSHDHEHSDDHDEPKQTEERRDGSKPRSPLKKSGVVYHHGHYHAAKDKDHKTKQDSKKMMEMKAKQKESQKE